MNKVEVFDPPICCSTGVCGPSVDSALVRFSTDLHWLANQRIAVERYNLAQQPRASLCPASDELAREHLELLRGSLARRPDAARLVSRLHDWLEARNQGVARSKEGACAFMKKTTVGNTKTKGSAQ